MIYVDVSTLTDGCWSGIANVTANVCRQLLARSEEVSFFAFDKIIKPSFVRNALDTASGLSLRLFIETGHAVEGYLSARPDRRGEIGVFPNFRRAGESFETELLIVHDLSFILLPELHQASRVGDYMRKIYVDAHAMHRVICVSEATRRDLIAYYGVDPAKISVSHLGVDAAIRPSGLNDAQTLAELGLADDQYFLVLGTIEPRKNIEIVLDLIKRRPDLLETHKFVFAGRAGWGKTFEAMCEERELNSAQVLRLGYVTEELKGTLLRNCASLLFCSWFEGFGLPVIEAMTAGAIVIGSRSSSVVEVGGEALVTFDPVSVEELSAAVDSVLAFTPEERRARREHSRRHAAGFTWERFMDGLLSAARTPIAAPPFSLLAPPARPAPAAPQSAPRRRTGAAAAD